MGELIRSIQKFSFKGLLVILFVFMLISAILFVELSGVQTYRYERSIDLLSSDRVYTKEEVSAVLPQESLLLWNSTESTSAMAYEQFCVILQDMKVGYTVCDVSCETVPSFSSFKAVIVLLSDLSPLGDKIISLCDWVYEGASAWFPLTLETNAYSSAIAQMIGIDAISPGFCELESIYVSDTFMIGGGQAYAVTEPFESSRVVVLNKNAATVYASAETSDGVPLVWKAEHGNGVFVVDNIGIYDKAMRGFYAASYSLLFDVCVYPVINASAFYLDDFPSQIPSGDNEWIRRDYQTSIRDFYINIWWPDMMNLADRYGLKYTGLAIESYDNEVDGTTNNEFDTGTFLNFGNMLLRKGGELGYHGYNHQPLCLGNKDYKGQYDYKTWTSLSAMKMAFDELVSVCKSLFTDAEFSLYVPPSNLLSDEGRDFLLTEYPQIRTISGIYFDDANEELDFCCVQEFRVDKSGIVDQPRVISGFILDDFQRMAAVSELNFHFVNSHFTHPDDALDPERGAELGWEALKQRFDTYLSWLYDAAPGLRNLTGTEASAAVQRFAAVSQTVEQTEYGVKIKIDQFCDEAQFIVRFNEKTPDGITGGTITHLTGGLYLLSADADIVEITLK